MVAGKQIQQKHCFIPLSIKHFQQNVLDQQSPCQKKVDSPPKTNGWNLKMTPETGDSY